MNTQRDVLADHLLADATPTAPEPLVPAWVSDEALDDLNKPSTIGTLYADEELEAEAARGPGPLAYVLRVVGAVVGFLWLLLPHPFALRNATRDRAAYAEDYQAMRRKEQATDEAYQVLRGRANAMVDDYENRINLLREKMKGREQIIEIQRQSLTLAEPLAQHYNETRRRADDLAAGLAAATGHNEGLSERIMEARINTFVLAEATTRSWKSATVDALARKLVDETPGAAEALDRVIDAREAGIPFADVVASLTPASPGLAPERVQDDGVFPRTDEDEAVLFGMDD